MTTMTTRARTVHRLKVSLRQVKPPVWRRIEVPTSIKLSDLADALEAAMGWLGGHLHSFEADGVLYETPDGENFGFSGACPPEDCGGPWGYGNLLAALSDPTHEDHDDLSE